MTEQPDNAMILAAVHQIFGRLDSLEGEMKQGFAQVDQRFAQVDQRFAQVDQRLAAMDGRLNLVDERLNSFGARFLGVERRLDFFTEQFLKHVTEDHKGAA